MVSIQSAFCMEMAGKFLPNPGTADCGDLEGGDLKLLAPVLAFKQLDHLF